MLLLALPGKGAAQSKPSQANLSEPQTYATWSASEFEGTGTPSIQTGMDADPDGDGMSNLLEYAFGGDPLFADAAAQPTARVDGTGDLVFTFNRDASKSDLIYVVETSTDMNIWRRIPSEIVHTKGTIESRRVTLPASSRAGFVRLNVKVEAG